MKPGAAQIDLGLKSLSFCDGKKIRPLFQAALENHSYPDQKYLELKNVTNQNDI